MWTVAVSGKKKLRIRKYPDTCGRGLIVGSQGQLNFDAEVYSDGSEQGYGGYVISDKDK